MFKFDKLHVQLTVQSQRKSPVFTIIMVGVVIRLKHCPGCIFAVCPLEEQSQRDALPPFVSVVLVTKHVGWSCGKGSFRGHFGRLIYVNMHLSECNPELMTEILSFPKACINF